MWTGTEFLHGPQITRNFGLGGDSGRVWLNLRFVITSFFIIVSLTQPVISNRSLLNWNLKSFLFTFFLFFYFVVIYALRLFDKDRGIKFYFLFYLFVYQRFSFVWATNIHYRFIEFFAFLAASGNPSP